MKRFPVATLLCSLLLAACSSGDEQAGTAVSPNLAGHWHGSFQLFVIGYGTVEVDVTLLHEGGGAFSGTFAAINGAGGTISITLDDEHGNVHTEISERGSCTSDFSGAGYFDGTTLELNFSGPNSCYGDPTEGIGSLSRI